MKKGKKQEENAEARYLLLVGVLILLIALILSYYLPVVINFHKDSVYSYPNITLNEQNTQVKKYTQNESIPFTCEIGKTGYLIDTMSTNDYGLDGFFFADKIGTDVYAFFAYDTTGDVSKIIRTSLNYSFSELGTDYRDDVVKKASGYLNGYTCNAYISEIAGNDAQVTMILYQVALDGTDGVINLIIYAKNPTTEILNKSNELIRKCIYSLRPEQEPVDEQTRKENYEANEAYYKQLEEEKEAIYSTPYQYYDGPIVDDYTEEDINAMIEEAEALEKEPIDYDTYYGATGIELTQRKYEECMYENTTNEIYLMLEVKGKFNSSFILKSPDMVSKYKVVKDFETEDGRVVWIKINEPMVGTYTLIQSDSRDAISYYYFYKQMTE